MESQKYFLTSFLGKSIQALNGSAAREISRSKFNLGQILLYSLFSQTRIASGVRDIAFTE